MFYSRGEELESAIERDSVRRGSRNEAKEGPVSRKNSFERKGGDTSQLRGDWQSDIPDIHWKLGPLSSLLMEIFEKAILPISTFGSKGEGEENEGEVEETGDSKCKRTEAN